MSLPFRTALTSTSGPAFVAEPGVVAERVEDTIQEARTTTTPDARLRGWINHGDEQVPIALLSGALAPFLAESETWGLHLYARAMRDAERDGACWTPLLDKMATSGVWPNQKGRVVLGGKVSVVNPLPIAQVLEPLRRWLREQTDGAALAPLAVFQASQVRALLHARLAVLPAVASFTGEFPTSRAEAVPAEERVSTSFAAVTPALEAPVAEAARGAAPVASPAVANRATASAASAASASHAVPHSASPTPLTAVATTAATPSVAAPGVPTATAASTSAAPTAPAAPAFGVHGVAESAAVQVPLHAASSHDAHIGGDTPHAVAAVPERVYTPEQVNGLLNLAAQATGRSDESQVRPDVRRAVNLLIEYRALGSDKLYSLYSACRKVKTWVVKIVGHVSATIELWRAALRDNNWLEVREAIVASSVARRDSVIRLILSRCGSSDVLCALCRDGDMPDVPQIARRVVRVDPKGLLNALRIAVASTGLRMPAADFVPLVQHEDPDVRAGAVSLLQMMVRAT